MHTPTGDDNATRAHTHTVVCQAVRWRVRGGKRQNSMLVGGGIITIYTHPGALFARAPPPTHPPTHPPPPHFVHSQSGSTILYQSAVDERRVATPSPRRPLPSAPQMCLT